MQARWSAFATAAGTAFAIAGLMACGGSSSDSVGGQRRPDASVSGGSSSGYSLGGSSGASTGGSSGGTSGGGSSSGSGATSGDGGDAAADDGDPTAADASGGPSSDGGSSSEGDADGGSVLDAAPEAAAARGGCDQTLPALSDYAMNGPFTATAPDGGAGPGNGYTIVQPTTLGTLNGTPFKHPIVTWGNGFGTSPSSYTPWFDLMASHGFVVIASNSATVTGQNMSDGLDWLVQQDTVAGSPYHGVLDTQCLFTVGYSLGGIAAINAGSHANVAATVVLHSGGVGGSEDAGVLSITPSALKGPLFIFTADSDGLCPPSTCVQTVLNDSDVQSFVGDLTSSSNDGHLIPLSSPGLELPGTMAWLRLWAYGDQGAKPFFWGSNATLCTSPWVCRSKQAGGAQQQSGF